MTNYPLLDIFWTMFEVFLFVVWFFLLFKVVTDIFSSKDLGGWGKAGWLVFVILLPLLGVLAYLIARGRSMGERDAERARQADEAVKAYIRDAAASGTDEAAGAAASPADQLVKLADLKASGHLSDAEYQTAKAAVLKQQGALVGSGTSS